MKRILIISILLCTGVPSFADSRAILNLTECTEGSPSISLQKSREFVENGKKESPPSLKPAFLMTSGVDDFLLRQSLESSWSLYRCITEEQVGDKCREIPAGELRKHLYQAIQKLGGYKTDSNKLWVTPLLSIGNGYLGILSDEDLTWLYTYTRNFFTNCKE